MLGLEDFVNKNRDIICCYVLLLLNKYSEEIK